MTTPILIIITLLLMAAVAWFADREIEGLKGRVGVLETQNAEDLSRIKVLENQQKNATGLLVKFTGNLIYKGECPECKGDLKRIDNTDGADVFECEECKSCYQNENTWDAPRWEEM